MVEVDRSKIERIAQHLPAGDDLTLITLKGHLLVEEALEELIHVYCKSPSALEGVELGFFVKLKLARALTGADELAVFWTACERLNSLRNALAHRLEHPLAQKRLNSFFATFEAPGLKWSRRGNDADDLRGGIIYLLGALHVIHKPLNPYGLGITA